MTHREFLAWREWLAKQWNEPDRSDHYLMQIALEIRSILLAFGKDQNQPTLDEFKIPFGDGSKEQPAPHETVEEAAEASKSRWAARRRGAKVIRRTPPTVFSEDAASDVWGD